MQSNMSPRDSIGVERIKTPTRLPSSVKFKSISSGRGHGIGLAQDGSVWHWSNCRVMQRVDIDWTVVQVTANWEYSSVLTDTGSILIVPLPDYIIHSQQDQIPEPTHVHAHVISRDIIGDSDDTIVQLAGLEDHTLALTKFGKVLKLHTVREIAFASNPSEFVETLVPFCAPEREMNDRKGKMRRFITGQFRSFAVYTADDTVLIGHIGDSVDAEPTRFSGLDVCKVSFGDYHRGALTNQGKLMTWGQYSSGALGHGRDDQNLQNPKYVDALRDKYVISIGFGGWQSSALVIDLKK
ncbi:hypothetical protein G6F56_007988 [Rhizopus delemar]|nr:hypothetical protein G6F56_007988 [Rhizopus delemar]